MKYNSSLQNTLYVSTDTFLNGSTSHVSLQQNVFSEIKVLPYWYGVYLINVLNINVA